MTYNTPILMNVATAFNVVLGEGIFVEQDNSTEKGCVNTDGNSTSELTGDGCQ